MSHKYSFHLRSEDRRRAVAPRIIIGRGDTETELHIVLRLLGYLLFFREHLSIQPSLHDDSIPFRPDLVELDYSLRPVLWVECGSCTAAKLHKLAVKVPEAEIWVITASAEAVAVLIHEMRRHELRRHRYKLMALDSEMVSEILGLLRPRNDLLLVGAEFDPPRMQFDFNGLWFDGTFSVAEF